MDQLLTTKEAALYLRVSPYTLVKHRQAKLGPKFVKIGSRTVRYRVSDLNNYINQIGA